MVKCSDCGYLTVRHTFERNLVEAERKIRDGEQWPVQRGTNICLYERTPLCFVMAMKIGNKNNEYSALEFKSAICEERSCEGFTNWQQGFTPKEHREMLDRLRLQEWQDKQRREDKRWRIIELVILGVMTTVVAGGFTVLGAMIERGILFR